MVGSRVRGMHRRVCLKLVGGALSVTAITRQWSTRLGRPERGRSSCPLGIYLARQASTVDTETPTSSAIRELAAPSSASSTIRARRAGPGPLSCLWFLVVGAGSWTRLLWA